MHRSQNYVDSTLYDRSSTISDVTSRTLTSREAHRLQNILKDDSIDYLYSATVSVGDALGGIDEGLFTWSTVKLYYSVFYAMRAVLALEGICVFYIRNRPFSLLAQPGKIAQKEQGQTHKIVIKLFKLHNSTSFLLAQPIGSDDPLQWLMSLREEVNYRIARFVEPNIPSHFEKIANVGIRRACQAYLNDKSYLYLFDPDHAILAYPLAVLSTIYIEFRNQGLSPCSTQDMVFFRKLLSDSNGPIAQLLHEIDDIRT